VGIKEMPLMRPHNMLQKNGPIEHWRLEQRPGQILFGLAMTIVDKG
jgi:hypothetical protein